MFSVLELLVKGTYIKSCTTVSTRFHSWYGKEIFLLSKASKLAQGPLKPLILGVSGWGIKQTTNLRLMLTLGMCTPVLLCVFMWNA
jgi:hypothetical protein